MHQAKAWFRPFARIGYAARGLIYTVIGFFAATAAIGSGETMGSRDALDRLLESGFGIAVAYILVLGLACYALWRTIQSVFDTDDHGTDAKGLAVRGGLITSAIAYSTLAFYTASRIRGTSSDSESGGGVADAIAGFVGTGIVSAVIAACLAGAAIAHVVKAVREKYADHIEADAAKMKIIHPIAKTGLIARGAVFAILAFLVALQSWRGGGTGDDVGSKQALDFVQSLPAGSWLLAAMGIGLLAFAAYSFTQALYRRINVEDA